MAVTGLGWPSSVPRSIDPGPTRVGDTVALVNAVSSGVISSLGWPTDDDVEAGWSATPGDRVGWHAERDAGGGASGPADESVARRGRHGGASRVGVGPPAGVAVDSGTADPVAVAGCRRKRLGV